MANKKLQPVSIDGIEFDALISEEKSMTSAIPTYPVEDGFSVSDTIILDPVSIQMTVYISNTPVTWLLRHGSSTDRVEKVCQELENMWLEAKLVKVVTTNAIYKDMGITSISIKKSKEIGYAREVSLQMQKVRKTARKVVTIPNYCLKSGSSEASAGTATTSNESSKGDASKSNATGDTSEAKKNSSILYGVAAKMNFL